jgi:uncharacterized protein DUF5681
LIKPRGRPFERGKPSPNPNGRPRGSRNRTTLAAEALLDGEAEALTRKAIEQALQGDPAAMRICMERILPPRRERLLMFDLPQLNSAEDGPRETSAILSAIAAGQITLSEAVELSRLVDSCLRALEAKEFDDRLKLLERALHEPKIKRPS